MKTLIITGGDCNIDSVGAGFHPCPCFDLIIAVDKGLEATKQLGLKPQYIVGDFDSVDKELLKEFTEIKIIELNPEKDFTDTHVAINLAIEKGSTDITILGAIGTRIDHTLANIHILKLALEKDINCRIINENNEISLINKNVEMEKNDYFKYISLIPLTTECKGVTLKGLKYTLNNETLKIGQSIGVSNEQKEDKATIKIKKGILILIRSKD